METIKGLTENMGVKLLNDDELDGVAGGVRDHTPEEFALLEEAKAKMLNATTEEERKMYEREYIELRKRFMQDRINGN